MNKLFTKIAALCLGATMAVGVGVAVASSGKAAEPVDAADGNTKYALINSTGDLEAGKSYIITNGTSGTVKAIATTSNSNNRKTTNATVSNNQITRGSSVMSFTLGGSSGAWTFQTENYAGTAGYLASAASGSNNYLRVINTAGTATISFSGNAAVINIGPHSSRTLIRYNPNNGSPMFACYSTGQEAVYLWKEVASKTLSSIALSGTYPTTFTQGDSFSHTGMIVTATYSDKSTAPVTSSAEWSSPDMSTTGTKPVTVSYTEGGVTKNASYDITISAAKALTSISLSGSYQTDFYTGDAFSHTGMIVTAHYDDSTTDIVTGSASWSSPNMSTAGSKTVTVSYTERGTTKTADYTISVVARALTGITLSGQTTAYTVNSSFSFDGTCTASYSNASDRLVTPTDVSSPSMSTVGAKTVTVSYTENGVTETAEYVIYVRKAPKGGTFYTLSFALGSNNSYAGNCDIDVTDNAQTLTWNLTGNSTTDPWRLGGKGIDGVDRPLYSKTQMGSAINSVDVTFGTIGITINSSTLIVSKNADFSNPIETKTFTAVASDSVTITPTSGSWPTDCYYKFVFNVTNTTGSNQFFQFVSAAFNAASKINATIQGAANVNSGSQWASTGVVDEDTDTVPGVTYSFTAGSGVTINSYDVNAGTFTATGTGTVTVGGTASDAYQIADKTVSVISSTPYITLTLTSGDEAYTGDTVSITAEFGNGVTGLTWSVTSGAISGEPSSSDSGYSAKIGGSTGTLTIRAKDTGSELYQEVSVDVTKTAFVTSPSDANVMEGKTTTLSAELNSGGAIGWTSDDNSVATVDNGVVTGVSEGTATITAQSVADSSVTATCEITVTEFLASYEINFGETKNTNPTEIKTDSDFKSTWSFEGSSDVTVGDISKIYGITTSQLKGGSGSASASISFTIPVDSYITCVEIVVETAGGSNFDVVSGAASAQTETQAVAVGTMTFDDYLGSEKSNYVQITSSASGAFYLSSIKIYYSSFAAELSASPSSLDIAVNSSKTVTLTPSHFTPESYSAIVKSGSSLAASAVTFSGNVATIQTGSLTGVTVFTITGTGGGKTASVDVTVDVTVVRNLLSLSITTASDLTAFKVGDAFDVGSLAITATFDAEPTEVVYSKANGNITLLESSPAIGYVFQEADIGLITSVIFELEVGTGDEMVEYSISVTDKTYAAKISSVSDLWDGQQIYFGDQEGTRVNIAHAGGNQLGSQAAVVHSTKGLCLDDLAHDGAYTVHREKIDDVIYYSFVKDGYYLEASSTSQNYLTRTETLSDNCRYIVSVSNGVVSMTNKGNTGRPTFRWNGDSNWFSQYQASSVLSEAVIYVATAYSEAAVADSFEENWLHMSDYNTNLGWCADEEHAYYSKLKPVWAAMGEYEKAAISAEAEARLIAWAAANGEHLDSNMNLVSNTRNIPLAIINSSSNVVAIVVITSVVSLTAIGGYFFLRKRKEN